MAIITYPLNGIEYTAENAETYLCTRTSGVYSSDNHFKATVTGTREVTISKGLAWIQNTDHSGKSVYNDSPVKISIPVADGALPRIDRIVLRFDKAANASTIVLKQGTAKTSPQAPDVSRTEILYELGLCTVSVPASSVSVNVGDVTSTLLDESVCGLMRDGVTGLPSQSLFDQFTTNSQREIDAANSKFSASQTKLDGDIANLISTKTSELEQTISTFTGASDQRIQEFTDDADQQVQQSKAELNEQKESWNEWYTNVQETLGESAAALGAVPLTRKVNGIQLDKDIDIPISKDYEITIPTNGWSANESGFRTVTVECSGVKDTDRPIIDVSLTGQKEQDEAILDSWMLVNIINTSNNSIQVFASEAPSVQIPIQMKVVY